MSRRSVIRPSPATFSYGRQRSFLKRETPHEGTGSGRFCLRGIPLLTFFPHPTRVSRGCGSVGRASPCQGEGRGFESRHPLRGAGSAEPQHSHGGLAERLGTGLQSRLHRFESGTHLGRLAQRERASLTRKRSLVRSQYRPPGLKSRRVRSTMLRTFSCCGPGSLRGGGVGGYRCAPGGVCHHETAPPSTTTAGIAWNPAGCLRVLRGVRRRVRVRIVTSRRGPGTVRAGVLYHLGRSWSPRQETDGYDGTLQASAARGPRW